MNELTPEVIAEGRRLLAEDEVARSQGLSDFRFQRWLTYHVASLLDAAEKAAKPVEPSLADVVYPMHVLTVGPDLHADLARLHGVIRKAADVISASHRPVSNDEPFCRECGFEWPCDPAKARDMLVEAVESRALPEPP